MNPALPAGGTRVRSVVSVCSAGESFFMWAKGRPLVASRNDNSEEGSTK